MKSKTLTITISNDNFEISNTIYPLDYNAILKAMEFIEKYGDQNNDCTICNKKDNTDELKRLHEENIKLSNMAIMACKERDEYRELYNKLCEKENEIKVAIRDIMSILEIDEDMGY